MSAPDINFPRCFPSLRIYLPWGGLLSFFILYRWTLTFARYCGHTFEIDMVVLILSYSHIRSELNSEKYENWFTIGLLFETWCIKKHYQWIKIILETNIPVTITRKLTLFENVLNSWHVYTPESSFPTFLIVSSFQSSVTLTEILHATLLSMLNPLKRTTGCWLIGPLKCHLIRDPVSVSQPSLNDVPADTALLVGVVARILASTVRPIQTIFLRNMYAVWDFYIISSINTVHTDIHSFIQHYFR